MRFVNPCLATCVAVACVHGAAKADLITDWNTIAVSTVVAGDAVANRQSRDLAMVHAAMFDAMNAIRPQYTSALVSLSGIRGYASREMAGAQAAHDVLVALFPAKQAALDASLAATAEQIPDDPPQGKQPKARGIAVGQQAAAAVLALRADDHAFEVTPYVQQPAGPGVYQFTPGCTAANMSVPGWGNVTPFTLPDPDAFPLPAHPSASEPEFLADLAETRDYGRSDSTIRTADQTNQALFFVEGAATAVNRLARTLVAQEPVETNRAHAAKQLLAHARLFAAINSRRRTRTFAPGVRSTATISGARIPRSGRCSATIRGRPCGRHRVTPSSLPPTAHCRRPGSPPCRTISVTPSTSTPRARASSGSRGTTRVSTSTSRT